MRRQPAIFLAFFTLKLASVRHSAKNGVELSDAPAESLQVPEAPLVRAAKKHSSNQRKESIL